MAAPDALTVGELVARFTLIELSIGLVVDEVRVIGSNVKLEREPFRLLLNQPAKVEVEISASSLSAFLDRESPGGLKRFVVRISDQRVYVDAVMMVLIPLPVSAVCLLRIDDGKRLFIDLESVSVLGAGPTTLVQKQLEAINPLVDVAQLPFEAALTGVQASEDRLLLTGFIQRV